MKLRMSVLVMALVIVFGICAVSEARTLGKIVLNQNIVLEEGDEFCLPRIRNADRVMIWTKGTVRVTCGYTPKVISDKQTLITNNPMSIKGFNVGPRTNVFVMYFRDIKTIPNPK